MNEKNTVKLLSEEIVKEVRKEMKNKLSLSVREKLNKNIIETVYSRPESSWYNRTYQFGDIDIIFMELDSFVNGAKLTIGIDGMAMSFEHNSIVNNSDQRNNLVYYLDDGHSPNKSSAPQIYYESNNFISITQLEAEELFEKSINKVLKKMQLKCS